MHRNDLILEIGIFIFPLFFQSENMLKFCSRKMGENWVWREYHIVPPHPRPTVNTLMPTATLSSPISNVKRVRLARIVKLGAEVRKFKNDFHIIMCDAGERVHWLAGLLLTGWDWETVGGHYENIVSSEKSIFYIKSYKY